MARFAFPLIRCVTVACFVSACGGKSTDDNDKTPAAETLELAQVAAASVRYVGANEHGVYYTDGAKPGLFAVDFDGKNLRQLNADVEPGALSVSSNQLIWRAYTGENRATMQISAALDDGSQRRDLVQGSPATMGTLTSPWSVPVDGQFAYWQSAEEVAPYRALINRVPLTGGTTEVVYENGTSTIRSIWLDGSVLYFNDANGIYSLPLDTKTPTALSAGAFSVVDPVLTDGSLYFVGGSDDSPARQGLFRVSDGQATQITNPALKKGTAHLALEGQNLFILDAQGGKAKVLRFDTRTGDVATLYEFAEEGISNIVVHGDYLLFALSTRVMRVLKAPEAT